MVTLRQSEWVLMDEFWRQIVEQIHASGRKIVLAITGGGSGAIADLLRVPGGSRTLLEAVVPYDLNALAEFLGRTPEHACSDEAAIALARRALWRAGQLARDDVPLVGLGATASLASDRPKKGDHRCHIATATAESLELTLITLQKGARDRAAEEQIVAHAILISLARACGLSVPETASVLGPNDKCSQQVLRPGDLLSQLLAGEISRLTVLTDGQFVTGAVIPRAVLAGSFNPLHAGHLGLARIASEILHAPVSFELSVLNVDKPPLSADVVRRRVAQFAWRFAVELTRAPTFLEKSRQLPGATFVVGADTAERIVHSKYYNDSETEMLAAIDQIASRGCRFLVAGRIDAEHRFHTLADITIPPRFAGLFTPIPESRFRLDLSSTDVRQAAVGKVITFQAQQSSD